MLVLAIAKPLLLQCVCVLAEWSLIHAALRFMSALCPALPLLPALRFNLRAASSGTTVGQLCLATPKYVCIALGPLQPTVMVMQAGPDM